MKNLFKKMKALLGQEIPAIDIRNNRIEYISRYYGFEVSVLLDLPDEEINEVFMRIVEEQYEEELKEKEIKILTMNDTTYNYYIKNVKGNSKTSYEQACLKMTRNMLLAFPVKTKKADKILYKYGVLHFTVKNGQVDWIKNGMPEARPWFKDRKRYAELTEMLGIID